MQTLLDLLGRDTLIALGALSLVTFVLGLLLVPLVIVRLPSDYYLSERRRRPAPRRHPVLRTGLRFLRNALGALLVVLGVAMLVLPGQGLITLLVGLMLLDFPGKFRLERRVLSLPRVLATINRLRERAGRTPLELPPRDA